MALSPEDRRGSAARNLRPVFFFHAGGLPIPAIVDLISPLSCLGRPLDAFDLDGTMWAKALSDGHASFADYLAALISEAAAEGGPFSVLIDWRDLVWLEQRSVFAELLRQPLCAVRLAFLDPAIQARRRLATDQGSNDEPSFAALARELVAVEEDEARGEGILSRYSLQLPKLWVEDLARPDLTAFRGLLARWSIPLPIDARLQPIDPPTADELEAIAAFRAEARRRHWAHALTPRPA